MISGSGGSIVHGGDVYRNEVSLDFSVNLNPMPMPREVMDAAAAGLIELHQYPDPLQQQLRKNISEFEKVPAENIICGSGASELIMAVCHAFRPEKALITAPCYAGYAYALRAAGAEVTEYALDERTDYALDERFLKALDDDIDIVFIADPNNPNGKLIDEDLKKKITAACEDKGIVLVIDECFLPLTERGLNALHENRSAQPEAGPDAAADDALHLRAFTKTFAIPGIRIGYLISGNTSQLAEIAKHLPEWNVSRISERTGEAAAKVLSETDYLESSVRMIAGERDFLRQEIENLGIRMYESDTNYLLFRSRADLYDRLLGKGILIRRCANFSGLDETFFRIAVRTHEDNKRLISSLKEVLQD